MVAAGCSRRPAPLASCRGVNLRLVGPLAVGALAVVLGGLWMGGALLTRRRRGAFASTYASSGGIIYTVFQVGCAAALILIGLGIVVVILVSRT
jgi:hypothetical protein